MGPRATFRAPQKKAYQREAFEASRWYAFKTENGTPKNLKTGPQNPKTDPRNPQNRTSENRIFDKNKENWRI